MHKVVLHPTYFPNIGHMIALWNAGEIWLEVQDFFDKQTYRNRMYFLGAQGRQILSVPVRHSKSLQRRRTSDIRVSNETDWARYHWKSLETAYRSSPYFEFYEDELYPFFQMRFDRLTDLTAASIQLIFKLLDRTPDFRFTEVYHPVPPAGVVDLRPLVSAKRPHNYIPHLEAYTQVFSDRHPFQPDLSFLDLLFMEGPASSMYLEKHAALILK